MATISRPMGPPDPPSNFDLTSSPTLESIGSPGVPSAQVVKAGKEMTLDLTSILKDDYPADAKIVQNPLASPRSMTPRSPRSAVPVVAQDRKSTERIVDARRTSGVITPRHVTSTPSSRPLKITATGEALRSTSSCCDVFHKYCCCCKR